ncbi:NADH-quinone oxidoreductase subunit NuoE [bacterium]|nr:NADH-quinone oxidoreductase subunit NuoE [candidate division CSSED10-310 bacterium]
MPVETSVETKWFETADNILQSNNNDPSTLIAILQDVQREIGYLPGPVLEKIARDLDIPLARVYAVATFYKAFKLQPSGKHIIKVCLGTACHIKGGPLIMKALEQELGVAEEQVTEDGMFSFEAVRCVGCCGLAPVIMVDEDFHGKMKPKEIRKILAKYRNE